ncbi:MAG: hypothetical protein J6K41_04025 [Paraprevotella sp.]|nr:hypothetical protein [Paraprevotella sp.]
MKKLKKYAEEYSFAALSLNVKKIFIKFACLNAKATGINTVSTGLRVKNGKERN